MAWNKLANSYIQTTFTKTDLTNYIKIQKEHIALMNGRLNRQFNATFVNTAGIALLPALGPVGWGAAAILAGLNSFYASEISKNLATLNTQTAAALNILEDVLARWKSDYSKVKMYIPVIRYQNSTSNAIVYLAAGSGVRVLSITLTNGFVLES